MSGGEEKKDAKEGEHAAPKKSKKMLFIIIGVVLLLVGAGVPAFMMLGGKKTEGKEAVVEKPAVLKLAKLEPFVVNLSESNSFVKVTILLEYDMNIIEKSGSHSEGGGHAYGGGASGGEGGSSDALPEAMKKREPMIKDAVIRVLSSKHAAEVLSAEGKEKLKEELTAVINEALGLDEGPVVNIYFTEFIVQ